MTSIKSATWSGVEHIVDDREPVAIEAFPPVRARCTLENHYHLDTDGDATRSVELVAVPRPVKVQRSQT